MKAKNILIVLLLSIFASSCKIDGKKNGDNDSPALAQSENVVVTLNAIVKMDDSFQIFYKDDVNAAFEEEKSIWVEFKGSDAPQDITFIIPEGELAYYLRMDFGTNDKQAEIIINHLKIAYYGKEFNIPANQYFNYFIPNESIQNIDKVTGMFKPVKMASGFYDPLCYSEEGLRLQIEALVK